jgi:predicted transcriptional regulator
MPTKHEQIIQYIEGLEVGEKISVRQIAKELGVSDGTAYRAIKDAEMRGIVNTIDRVGTVRIEKKQKSEIEKLTFAEVVGIVDGTVLGGKGGLHKTLNRFVIGAMEIDAMMRYLEPGNLLIVGNRCNVHRISLEQGTAVLITGGFDTTDEVKQLADQLDLPIISTSYDTFTVASLINRAIYDRLIKKEILMVEDLLVGNKKTCYLHASDTVGRFHELVRETGHSRYPVVDRTGRVVGVVTARDVIGADAEEKIEKVMTRSPIVVIPRTPLASAAHEMVWEGIELLPVVDQQRKLLGVISRQDVIEALQSRQNQPQVGETIPEISFRGFREVEKGDSFCFRGTVTPQMTDGRGFLSTGVLTTLLTETAMRLLRRLRRDDLTIQNLTLYTIKPIQIESVIEIYPRILELGRQEATMEIEAFHENQLSAKALITAQIVEI